MGLCVMWTVDSDEIFTQTGMTHLDISSIFLDVTDGYVLIAMNRNSPSLVGLTVFVVTRITSLELVRITR